MKHHARQRGFNLHLSVILTNAYAYPKVGEIPQNRKCEIFKLYSAFMEKNQRNGLWKFMPNSESDINPEQTACKKFAAY